MCFAICFGMKVSSENNNAYFSTSIEISKMFLKYNYCILMKW